MESDEPFGGDGGSSNSDASNSTNDDYSDNVRSAATFWFEGILVPSVGSVGIVGNVLCVAVLTRRDLDLKPSFRNLFVNLCVFDTLFLAAVCLFFALPIHWPFYEDDILPRLTLLLLPLVYVLHTGSVYSVVAVAVERYLIICNPFKHGSQEGSGARYVVAIALFSIAYNVNKFFEVDLGYETVQAQVWNDTSEAREMQNVTKLVVVSTRMRDDPDYTKTLITANFVVMAVVPLLSLSLCHVYTYRQIREDNAAHNAISSKKRRDMAMAMLFSVIIACFLLCQSGKFVLNFYEMAAIFLGEKKEDPWPLWAFVLTRVSHFLLVVNSSVNFYIYCFRDAKFRCALMSVIGMKTVAAVAGDGGGGGGGNNNVATLQTTAVPLTEITSASGIAQSVHTTETTMSLQIT